MPSAFSERSLEPRKVIILLRVSSRVARKAVKVRAVPLTRKPRALVLISSPTLSPTASLISGLSSQILPQQTLRPLGRSKSSSLEILRDPSSPIPSSLEERSTTLEPRLPVSYTPLPLFPRDFTRLLKITIERLRTSCLRTARSLRSPPFIT